MSPLFSAAAHTSETVSQQCARYARENRMAAKRLRSRAFKEVDHDKARGLLETAHMYEEAALDHLRLSRNATDRQTSRNGSGEPSP